MGTCVASLSQATSLSISNIAGRWLSVLSAYKIPQHASN
jgi:hypothetical protein